MGGVSQGIPLNPFHSVRCRLDCYKRLASRNRPGFFELAVPSTCTSFGTARFLHVSILALRSSSASPNSQTLAILRRVAHSSPVLARVGLLPEAVLNGPSWNPRSKPSQVHRVTSEGWPCVRITGRNIGRLRINADLPASPCTASS